MTEYRQQCMQTNEPGDRYAMDI